MSSQTNIAPDLRFPSFEQEWKTKRLGNLCSTFKSGSGITSSEIFDEGDFPVYGGNGLRGYTDSYTHEGFFFLIGRQGALCGNINRVRNQSFISEHAIAVQGNEEADTEWLAQRLDYFNLNRLSESSAQPGLSVGKLTRLKITVPTLPEQQKIADFLTAVDRRIGQLIQKKALLEDYKKGVMQQLFTQAIRFKDDYGNEFPDWEEKDLKEFASPVKTKNRDMAVELVLTNSATQGIISQRDYFDKDIANAKNIGGYYVVSRDDFVYNPRISETAPVGPIKRNHLTTGVMSPLYTVFRFDQGCATFFEFYFQTNEWHVYMNSVANFGARHDRMAITTGDFYCLPMPFPSLAEQTKIADFFTAIDRKIDSVATQITESQTFKKGLLQQMFV